MQQLLTYREWHVRENLFTDSVLAATAVSLDNCRFAAPVHSLNGITVWFDGELFPEKPSGPVAFARLLLGAFADDNLMPFLKAADGVFSAVIYDSVKKTIHFCSDRFGLRRLYLCTAPSGIAWSTEIKGFKAIPELDLQPAPEAVGEFLRVGHFTGSRTWFREVSLLEPASCCTWDITACRLNHSSYWNIDETVPRSGPFSINSLADELGESFRKAVKKRCGTNEKIGLGLSGGLDSRAIFAALPDRNRTVTAVTFGRPACADIRIARQVAQLRPVRHIIHEITAANWLDNRLEGIWLTDGQLNMLHMHGIERIDDLHALYDIELNGFLGDALLGGSYAGRPEGEFVNFLDRGRRFIASGLYLGELAYHTRLPFFDRDLINLTLAIPAGLRRNSQLYNRMLLREFPDYFTAIPWQKTGAPISRTSPFDKAGIFVRKGIGKLYSVLPFLSDPRNYFDYAAWIRTEPARTLFSDTLGAADAPLFNFAAPAAVRNALKTHMAGWNRADLLGRYLTVDVWLRRFSALK